MGLWASWWGAGGLSGHPRVPIRGVAQQAHGTLRLPRGSRGLATPQRTRPKRPRSGTTSVTVPDTGAWHPSSWRLPRWGLSGGPRPAGRGVAWEAQGRETEAASEGPFLSVPAPGELPTLAGAPY